MTTAGRGSEDFHQPKPVEKCKCGRDCSWCVGSNRARLAFPKAKVPPMHDADTDHQCSRCFMKDARAAGNVPWPPDEWEMEE